MDERALQESRSMEPEVSSRQRTDSAYGNGDAVAVATTAQVDAAQNPWQLLNDRLCGRWKYAIPLAVVTAVVAAAIGYAVAPTKYESVGIIRVAPNITPIMHQTAETGLMPLYSNYIQTQASLLTSSRVLERAASNLDLSRTEWQNRQQALSAMREVRASPDRNSELIRVRFAATTPRTAQAVVNAVIEAYDALHGSAVGDDITRKLAQLRTIRETQRTQQRQKQADLEEFVENSEYGVSEYGSLSSEKALQILAVEAQLRELRLQLNVAMRGTLEADEAGGGEPDEGGAADEPARHSESAQVDPARLEAFDPELARLGRMKEDAALEVAQARERFTSRHPALLDAEERLRVIDRLYRNRFDAAKKEWVEKGLGDVGDPVKELEYQIAQLEARLEQEREEARRLTQTQFALSNLQSELAEIEQDLAETTSRLRALEIESEAIRTGRIIIAAMGDLPTSPNTDRRRQLAFLGFVGGMGGVFGLFFLVGSFDRRAFAVVQLSADATGRVLGVLPELPKGIAGLRAGSIAAGRHAEAAGVAAHCVHQIRNRIEALRPRRRTGKSVVIAVSSPAPGDGKTSVVLALSASYATSGSRTVVVDCDLSGQALTRQTHLASEQGLREALAVGSVDGCVHSGPLKNFSILPVGMDQAFGPERVRAEDLRKLFEQLRSQFDVVLVDTGPTIGSIESLPVAATADGVVLTMRRGGRQSHLADCVESLRSVGATYLGVVLNFARRADCARYASESRLSRIEPLANGVGADAIQAVNGSFENTRNALLTAMQVGGVKSSDSP